MKTAHTLYALIVSLLLGLGMNLQAQTTLAEQDFDSANTWSYSSDVAFFSHQGSNTLNDVYPLPDGWSGDGFYGIIDLADATGLDYSGLSANVLGELDLDDEGDFGTGGDATTTFSDISVVGYSNVTLTFDYDVEGYNANSDEAFYELVLDGVDQGRVTLQTGSTAGDDAEGTITENIPGGTGTVGLKIIINNNGSSGFSGFDNFLLEGSLASGPIDPTGLTVVPSASPQDPKTQIDITYTQNGNSDDVLVAINDEDVFGTPVDATTYTAGDSLAGGGTIVGVGGASGLTESDLCPGKTYYVKAWSVDGTTTYSSGTASVSVTTNSYSLQNNDFNSWTAVDVDGDDSWFVGSSGDFASANGFSGTNPEEDWLISPAFDLDSFVGETFEFDYRSNFDDPLVVGLELFWTNNYTGDPTTTTWTAFTTVNTELDTNKSTGSPTSYTSTSVDLSSISGTQVVLGFQYITGSSAQDARDWDIQDPLVSGNNSGDEQITLAATPASVDEGSTLTVNLSVPTTVGAATEFCLSSNDSDASELDFPDTVTIPMGQDNVDFTVTGLTDSTVDGDQIVNLVANAGSYIVGNLDITVVDQDVPAATGDVLITQYYEGDTGNNKWIEITNVGSSSITLTGYEITLWSNANTEAWKSNGGTPNNTEDLSSVTLAAGQSYLIANSASTLPFAASNADITSSVTFFNGNDSVVLYSDPTGYDTANIVDAVAVTDSGDEGANKGFVRIQAVDGYNLSSGSSIEDFDGDGSEPAVWQEITVADANNAVSGDDAYLGSSSLVTTTTPSLTFTQGAVTVNEGVGTVNVVVQINDPDGNAVDVDVEFDSGNSTAVVGDVDNYATSTVTFGAGAVDGDTQTVVVTIDDDSSPESTEVASFILANVVTGGGAIIGTPSAIDISIQDNDTVIPDLIISEIVDPADDSSARYIEFYNPTGNPIDLGADSWTLTRFSNGNTSGTDIALSGTVPAGGTFVIANNDANYQSAYSAGASDQDNGNVSYNGDDTFALYFGGGNLTGTLVDIYGEIGVNGLGEAWEYTDARAYRNDTVTTPNTTWTASEWTIESPANVADATPDSHPEVVLPTITLAPSPTSFAEDAGAAASTVTLTLGQAPASYPFTVNLSSDDTGEATVPATVNVTTGTTATFDIAAVTDGVFDGSQIVTITASATGYQNGTSDVTVTDVDSFTDPGNVYISQYYHATGSSFGELWVEICVPTGETVNFSGYTLAVWSDSDREGWKTDTGTPTATVDLSSLGNVTGPAEFLISDGFAVQPTYATADITDLNFFFTGDDSVVLYSGTAATPNLVDAVSITSTDTATDTSIVRTATGVGFDLNSGSSYADFPGIWTTETTSNVDNAGGTDNIYLGFCDFGSSSGTDFNSFISSQSGAGSSAVGGDKNANGVLNEVEYAFRDVDPTDEGVVGDSSDNVVSQADLRELLGGDLSDVGTPATTSDDQLVYTILPPTPADPDVTIYVVGSSVINDVPDVVDGGSDDTTNNTDVIATYSGSAWTPGTGTVSVGTGPGGSDEVTDAETIGSSASRFVYVIVDIQ